MTRKLLLLLLLILAVPAAAEDARLFVERIEVRNNQRVSPEVVIAESRLRANRWYTEAELRDAATRLSRLPFLLSVDFSLEKGSERGRHVLVLSVSETRPFFFLIDAVPYFDEDLFTDIDYDDRPGASDEDLALGFRWFVGRRGAVHLAFTGVGTDRAFTREYAGFAVGYTQYDLFGTRAFATLNLKRPVEGVSGGRISPQFVLGVPLARNHTLTVDYDEARFEDAPLTVNGVEYQEHNDQHVVSLRWTYNTSNDPFFPTRGTLVSLSPHYAWGDGVNIFSGSADGLEVETFESRTFGARANATRFFELTERSSAWADLRGEWAQIDRKTVPYWREVDGTASSAGVGVGYAVSLWSREERAQGGDSRFEFTTRYTHRPDPEFQRPFTYDDVHVFQASAAWLRRTSFGTLRVGVGYAW